MGYKRTGDNTEQHRQHFTFRARPRQPGRGRGRRGRPVEGLQRAVRGRREGEPVDKRRGRGSDGIEVLLSRQLAVVVAAAVVVVGAAVREVDAPAAAHGVVRGEEDLAVPAAAAWQAVATPHRHRGLYTCTTTTGQKNSFSGLGFSSMRVYHIFLFAVEIHVTFMWDMKNK